MKNTRMQIAVFLLLCGICQPILRAAQAARTTPSASEMRELRTSLNTLFQAMKNGDVATIQQYCSGQMSSEYKTLFEQNQDYPAFLRNFYKGATFSIANVTPIPDGDVVVDVEIELGGGSKSVTRLNAKRFDGSPAKWKVTNVVTGTRTSRHE